MFRATILKVKIGTIPVKDFKMVQETKAAIQAELRKLTLIATPLSNTIISYWILGTIEHCFYFTTSALSLAKTMIDPYASYAPFREYSENILSISIT